ncbi:hypothetical protein AWW67_02710 [Roseivirga seohaensis]|uniref:Uncharacterized protein n=2 Tax=Roseivirga seohaensis TaxID=1914963 RepID=A0A0L8AP83_9BACT|nr:hypothetical protein [Roseivirga seohaensis]KOF04035.1 hypothetical protein OB69_03310 [Roseivirga seohaensis subsp. aquiponti]KYG84044.1 hypothetical protein AWW67_02710 [Roseivirga seohaensis]
MEVTLKFLIGTAALAVMIGLYSPWRMLWWMSKQNRLLVLKYYGIPLVVLGLIYLLFYSY